MDKDSLIALAKAAAQQVLLDPALVCAVCEQESNWNPWATRPEPGFEAKYVDPLHLKALNETWCRSMSWGLMQLMGEVARELGFSGEFLSELCDPATGLLWGCKKLRKCLDARSDNHAALLLWNGGGNLAYPDQVLARMKNYWTV